MIVKINQKEYPIEMNFSALSKFGKICGIKDVMEVQNFLQEILSKGEKMAFDDLDIIATLIHECIREGCRKEKAEFELDVEDALNLMTEDLAVINNVFDEFLAKNSNEQKKTNTRKK